MKGRRGGKKKGKGAKESLKHFCLIKFQDEYQNIQNTIRCQIAKWKIQDTDTDTDARYRYGQQQIRMRIQEEKHRENISVIDTCASISIIVWPN